MILSIIKILCNNQNHHQIIFEQGYTILYEWNFFSTFINDIVLLCNIVNRIVQIFDKRQQNI